MNNKPNRYGAGGLILASGAVLLCLVAMTLAPEAHGSAVYNPAKQTHIQISQAITSYRQAALTWLSSSASKWVPTATKSGIKIGFGPGGQCHFPSAVTLKVTFNNQYLPRSLAAMCALYDVPKQGGSTSGSTVTYTGNLIVWPVPAQGAKTWYVSHGYQALAGSSRLQSIVAASSVHDLTRMGVDHSSFGVTSNNGSDFIVDSTSPSTAPYPAGAAVRVSKWSMGSLPVNVPTLVDQYTFSSSGSGSGTSTPAPTLSLTLNPTSVQTGGSTTITWSSTNATSCALNGSGVSTSGSKSSGPLTSSRTYTLACSGAGGSAQKSATVTVTYPSAAILSFYASPSTIAKGGHTTLYWRTQYATACTLSGGTLNSRSVAVNGSQYVSGLSSSTTYTLSCSGRGGSAAKSTQVTVAQPPIIFSFSASSVKLNSAGTVSLSWKTLRVTNGCDINQGVGSVPTGSLLRAAYKSVYVSSTRTYTLTCYGFGGQKAQKSVRIVVGGGVPGTKPTINSLTASPRFIRQGASVNLSWSTSNATSCTINGVSVPVKGGRPESPRFTTTYTLSCKNAIGTVSQSVKVTVLRIRPFP